MVKYSFLLFLCLSFILAPILFLACYANYENEKLHIVYMGSLPNDETYSPTIHHLTMLQQVIEGNDDASNHLIRSYKRSFNGFAAMITNKQREKLSKMERVVSVFRSKTLKLHTTRSWDFMGLKDLSPKSRNQIGESDIIIGVLDTGIWPESDSFKDEGFGPIPKKWKGACAGGNNFTCNNKLIGARYYTVSSYGLGSARDDQGHGTHTSSTAAGNRVENVSFYGVAEGIARGGVPSSRIAMYSVCPKDGCSYDAIMGGFDDAIADGVDLITLSIGNDMMVDFKRDVIAIGSFHAMEKGILTVNSAGNDGPRKSSITSLSPWMFSIAASTIDRRIIDKVSLGNGVTLSGKSVNSFTSKGEKSPFVTGRRASYKGCPSYDLGDCFCLDPKFLKGKIVICDVEEGYDIAYAYGAFGSISKSHQFESSVTGYPSTFLDSKAYDLALSYANSTTTAYVEILSSEAIIDTNAPIVADFSSRGPNPLVTEIMKPDISAPGVEILAAYSPIASPSDFPEDKRSVKYNILSGTSMSCPHAAGVAAYVKSFHPDWSPAAIKSSIMTTAKVMKGSDDLKEFAYGSGHVDPLRAINPGLIFDLSKEDYVSFLCNIGYDTKTVRLMSGDNSTCPSPPPHKGSLVKDINYPSFATQVQPMKPFEINFTRTVTNVGLANSTYKASVLVSLGLNISIVPQLFTFKSLQDKHSFIVNIVGGMFKETILSSSLMWTDGIHSVRFPIVIDVSKI